MVRHLAALMTTLALGACSPYAFGSGSGSGAKPGDDGPTDEGTGTGPEDTTGGPEGTGTTAATAPPPGDESVDGPPMDEGPVGHPVVVISDAPMFDFGSHDLTNTVDQTFTVTNDGDGDATAVQVGDLGEPFSIVDHDCSDVLAPGATCEVQVRFLPEQFGDVQAELQIGFQDQGMETMASLSLVGRGVGTTRNLVINGGGELGEPTDIPPMGWTIDWGPNWSANVPGMSWEGLRTISPGWGPPGDHYFTLDQEVDIAVLTTWGDAAGLQIHYRSFHRSVGMGDDPTWIELRVLDGSGGEMGLHPGSLHSGTDWSMSEGTFPAPPGAHSVRISLQCDRMTGDSCSGFFDDIQLWAEWAG